MRTKGLLIFLLCSTAGTAQAADKQIWACRTDNPGARPLLHLVEWGPRSYVKFAHVRFSAQYENGGDRQGWYWNNEGDGYYRYAMLLDDDGKAWFHDFSHMDEDGLSAPVDRFTCQQTS
jgi:hypothetical protein